MGVEELRKGVQSQQASFIGHNINEDLATVRYAQIVGFTRDSWLFSLRIACIQLHMDSFYQSSIRIDMWLKAGISSIKLVRHEAIGKDGTFDSLEGGFQEGFVWLKRFFLPQSPVAASDSPVSHGSYSKGGNTNLCS